MKNSFWEGGPAAYGKGLRDEIETRSNELRLRREGTLDAAERTQIALELLELEIECKRQQRGIGGMLF